MSKYNTCEFCGEYLDEQVSVVVPGMVMRICNNTECSHSKHYSGVKSPTPRSEPQAEKANTVFDRVENSTRSITVRPSETSIRLEKDFPLAELPMLTSEQLLASLQALQLFVQENSIPGCSDAEMAYWFKYFDEGRKLMFDLVERRKLKISKERQAQFIEKRKEGRSEKNAKQHKKTQKSVVKAAKSSLTPEHQKLIKQAHMFGVDNPEQYATIAELRKALAKSME